MRTDTRLPLSHEGEWWVFLEGDITMLRSPEYQKHIVLHRGKSSHTYGQRLYPVEDFFRVATAPGVSVCPRCFMEVRPGTHPLARDRTPYPRWRQMGYREQQARRWAAHRASAARNVWRELHSKEVS